MTLKGKKNHYNVKLLKGYGCSISLKNKKVCLKGGRDVFTGKQRVIELPARDCDFDTHTKVMMIVRMIANMKV